MKRRILLAGFIFFQLTIFAQSKINFFLAQQIHKKNTEAIDVFIKGDLERIKELIESHEGLFKYAAGNIAVARLTYPQISEIIASSGIERIEAYPKRTIPMNDTMLIHNRIIAVHHGDFPLNQAYDGTGVVVGVMDTGIDFTHPDFLDSTGKTRVKFYWDQRQPYSSNTPVTYGYGQEWDAVQIDSGKAIPGTDGHGTHVAGIVAGNGRAIQKYKGVAPGADLVVVNIDFNNPNPTLIADAVDYIYSKAAILGKPCVINASIGDYYGSHDGKDLQAQIIRSLIDQKNGRAFVASAGNKGDSPIHLQYSVTGDTSFTLFNPVGGSVYMEMWSDTADFKNVKFAVGADQFSPIYSFRGRTGFRNIASCLGIYDIDTIYKNGHRLGIVETYGDLIGDTYSMIHYITPDSTAYKWRLITTGSGKFDLWNLNMVSSGLPSSKLMPDSIFYKYPDLQQTIVSSYQCLDNVITVGNYTNRKSYIDYNHNLYYAKETPGKRHSTSSCGPTRDGRLKPDIIAPGDMILSSLVQSLRPVLIASNPSAITPEAYHVRDGGTSSSGPGVAGIAALYLQKNPGATAMQVKNAILSCARQDAYTGITPNMQYGYGKADGFKTLTECSPNATDHYEKDVLSFQIFPNPANAEKTVNFRVSLPAGSTLQTLFIYNELGICVSNIAFPTNNMQLSQHLAPGIYFCTLVTSTHIHATKKLVIL
jgi:subtilisin family serine protease